VSRLGAALARCANGTLCMGYGLTVAPLVLMSVLDVVVVVIAGFTVVQLGLPLIARAQT
jgi:hypothetical protein